MKTVTPPRNDRPYVHEVRRGEQRRIPVPSPRLDPEPRMGGDPRGGGSSREVVGIHDRSGGTLRAPGARRGWACTCACRPPSQLNWRISPRRGAASGRRENRGAGAKRMRLEKVHDHHFASGTFAAWVDYYGALGPPFPEPRAGDRGRPFRPPPPAPRARLVADPSMKIKDVIRLLRDDGWEPVVQKGSHRQFKHASKKGRVTVAGRLGDELPKGSLASIPRQAQLKERP